MHKILNSSKIFKHLFKENKNILPKSKNNEHNIQTYNNK
jgi:hypothetical protein